MDIITLFKTIANFETLAALNVSNSFHTMMENFAEKMLTNDNLAEWITKNPQIQSLYKEVWIPIISGPFYHQISNEERFYIDTKPPTKNNYWVYESTIPLTPTSIIPQLYLYKAKQQSIEYKLKYENTSDSFTAMLRNYSNSKLTQPQIKQWIELNKTALQYLPWKDWDLGYCPLSFCPTTVAEIRLSSIPEPNQYIKSSSILKSIYPIPTLFLNIVEEQILKDTEKLPKSLSHDLWLFEALQSLRVLQYPEDFTPWVKENSKIINSIRQSFAHTPKFLGAGADGNAYDIGNGKVLKIFLSEAAFKKAKQALDRLHSNPLLAKTEAMLYDVGKFNGSPVYYYIIEKMSPISNIDDNRVTEKALLYLSLYLKQFINNNPHLIKPLKQFIDDPKLSRYIAFESKSIANDIATSLPNSITPYVDEINKLDLNPNWLPLFIEEFLLKYLTGRTDLHTGNVGITSFKTLRFFDPVWQGNSSLNVN